MWYVYYLHHPDGELLYVGRSNNPTARLHAFMLREDVMAEIIRLEEYECFEDACARELEVLRQRRPPYNKRLISSPGTVGKSFAESEQQRLRKSQSAKARGRSQRHCDGVQRYQSNRTPEHAAKIAAAVRNRTPAQKAAYAAAANNARWKK